MFEHVVLGNIRFDWVSKLSMRLYLLTQSEVLQEAQATLVESRMTGRHLMADLLTPGTASDDNGMPCMHFCHVA